MKIKDLKNFLSDLPDDMDIVISKTIILDEEDEVFGIVDIPICGVMINENIDDPEQKELRFMLDSGAAQSCFVPETIIKIDEIAK